MTPYGATARTYVDWELREWPNLYRNELESCVRLPFQGENYVLPEAVLLDNATGGYNASQIRVDFSATPFHLSEVVHLLTCENARNLRRDLERRGPYHNGRTLRLMDFVPLGRGQFSLRLQPLNYDDYLATNLVVDASLREGDSLRDMLLRREGHKLEILNESPLGNMLGIDVILFTSDGRLILQQRSKSVAIRPCELSTSFSGAASPEDLCGAQTLVDLKVTREAWEEIAIEADEIEKESLKLVGIGRELARGGQPGLFFCGKVRLTEKEVRKRSTVSRDRWEFDKLIFYDFGADSLAPIRDDDGRRRFLEDVDKFISRHGNRASIPLLVALAFWIGLRCVRKVTPAVSDHGRN